MLLSCWSSYRYTSPDPVTSSLDQSGRAAGPGGAATGCDPFDVFHVRAGLREDVVQIVADADEAEPLGEELGDARRAEQKDPEDDVVLPCCSDQPLGGIAELWRRVHVGKLVLLEQSHRHAEIVLAEEQEVHALHRGDLVDVLDAVGSF